VASCCVRSNESSGSIRGVYFLSYAETLLFNGVSLLADITRQREPFSVQGTATLINISHEITTVFNFNMGRDADHSPPSNAKVPPNAFMACGGTALAFNSNIPNRVT
jgi:hypothetical protein